MKRYRFDYIRESVEKWTDNIPKTLEFIEGVPFGLLQYQPMTDTYGEVVDDFKEWYRQRHEYCVKLADEYKQKGGKNSTTNSVFGSAENAVSNCPARQISRIFLKIFKKSLSLLVTQK